MKFKTLAAAAALAVAGVAAPAMAQDAGVTVGAKVYGPDGAEVGTIESVNGDAVVINTGNLSAALPADSFAPGDNGPTLGWNKAELEAAVTEANQAAEQELAAALVPEAEVYSSDAVLLGKVESVDGDNVVVTLESGPVALPKAQMALQADKVTFVATAADVQAAAAAATGGDTAQGGD